MNQKKKPQYTICPRLTDKSVNSMKKALRELKKESNASVIREFFNYSPHMTHSLDLFIFAEERFWETQGNHVIFPENVDVLNNLYRAKFKFENAKGFDLPFSSFILAMPQGYKIDGYEIPSVLITWEKYRTSEHSILYPFFDWIKYPRPSEILHQASSADEMELGIIFRDANESMSYHRTLCFGSALPEILQATSTDEFQKILGNYSQSNIVGIIPSDDHDLNVQFRLFKLIAALGVYNLAKEGGCLISGFPGSVEPKVIGRDANQRLIMSTLGNSHPPKSSNQEAAETHYRSWFFRQLNDERFYRNEYKDMKRGSRIIFVQDTVVGRKVNAYTQK